MKRQFLVVGLGRFGASLALLLEEVDMQRERRAATAKLPAVPNPLEK
jgi:Trk K+ transport system NAD-binding subunit